MNATACGVPKPPGPEKYLLPMVSYATTCGARKPPGPIKMVRLHVLMPGVHGLGDWQLLLHVVAEGAGVGTVGVLSKVKLELLAGSSTAILKYLCLNF